MIVTTTNTIEGRRTVAYPGPASGETTRGATSFHDLSANIRDIVGGRAGSYESELRKAREIAVQEMREEAERLGANAIVGVDLDYETVGQNGGMLMVSAAGTAVTLE